MLASQDKEPWQSCQCTFSGFVAAQIFDWAEGWAEDSRTLYSEAITPEALAWMRKRFSAGPTARVWPWTSHRFYDQRCRLRTIPATVGEECWVRATTFADMDRLLDELAPFYDGEL